MLHVAFADECPQTGDVTAAISGQKPHTFAGTIGRLADANVVEISEAEAVDFKAATADFAANFAERVVLRDVADLNAEYPDATLVALADQSDRTGVRHRFRHTLDCFRATHSLEF